MSVCAAVVAVRQLIACVPAVASLVAYDGTTNCLQLVIS